MSSAIHMGSRVFARQLGGQDTGKCIQRTFYEPGHRRGTRREADGVVKRAGQRRRERGRIRTTRKGAVNTATIFFKYKFELGYY